MSAHPWKYWLRSYWFLPYCLVKSSIEIRKYIFGHAAIHQYWLTQFHKAFLNSHLLDYAILVDFVVWIKCFARFYRKGYLSYLSTPDYQYWLADLTPELDPNLLPQPIVLPKPTLGAHMEQ